MVCVGFILFFVAFLMFTESYDISEGVFVTVFVFAFIVMGIYYHIKDKGNSDNKIRELKQFINNDKPILWSNVFTRDFLGRENEVRHIIEEGISKGLFEGELNDNDFVKPYIDDISEETLKYLDNLALLNGLTQYNFVDITRSSNAKIENGTYVYKFTDNNDLILLKAPFNIISGKEGKKYPVFNRELLSKNYIIDKTSIRDFQYFGNQLLETNLSTNDGSTVIDTMLSEILFGSSYTILKGINKMKNKHTIRDARVVQVIFDDQTDIEFSGINIFYDLNRKFGIVKNKGIENSETIEKISHAENPKLSNNSLPNELRLFKDLLDDNIITEAEFNAKKKELLGL